MDAINFLTIISIVLALINIFQWFDRRARNKALHKFLEAAHDMSERFTQCSGDKIAVEHKARDMSSFLNAAIATVHDRKARKEIVVIEKERKRRKK